MRLKSAFSRWGAPLSVLGVMASASALAGCASGEDSVVGRELYEQRLSTGNAFACATCHALSEPTDDGWTRPGHPIGGAPLRASFKNGQVGSFLEAVNSCLDEWMAVPEPWKASDADFRALRDFLLESDAAVEEISFEIVAPLSAEQLGAGDPIVGRETFNRTCITCHGQDGIGTPRAPVILGYVRDVEYIAERVRLSGDLNSAVYEGLTGGRMPFWSRERLSDQELADITMYLAAADRPGSDGPGDDLTSIPGVSADRVCEATHPKVGQVAVLTEKTHDVGGSVTIVDDCTLEFTDFTFDGQGITVELYGHEGTFETGYSMSGDLKRATPYSGENFRVSLPEGSSLDDLTGVSVWCVPIGISFGEGAFAAVE